MLLGLVLCIGWLVADGLDGMIARATGTASAVGRILDGLCDHGVFVMIYVALALSIGTGRGWLLACTAGAAHAVQSNLYEAERARFHRRLRGEAEPVRYDTLGNPAVRFYDFFAHGLDSLAARFDEALRVSGDRIGNGMRYGIAAAPAMKAMSLLSANVRVAAIFLACLAGSPKSFWWFELVPLTMVALLTIMWHRLIERRLVAGGACASPAVGVGSAVRE